MGKSDFLEYSYLIYNKRSGAALSYVKSIEIIDELFLHEDVFGLKGKSLCNVTDIGLATKVVQFIRNEEYKYRNGEDSSSYRDKLHR